MDYKDLDQPGLPFSVADVEKALEETYEVPEVMNRTQYVYFAGRFGLHRVLHGRPDELILRSKFAREVTRHLNFHELKGDLVDASADTEETNGRFWR
jgi:hypothetical protein